MTRMPPEMSTTATPTLTLPLHGLITQQQQHQQHQHESLSALQQSRSRFMITDILAGNALQQQQQQHGGPPPPTTPSQATLQNYFAQQQHQQQRQQKHFFLPISETSLPLRHFHHQNSQQHVPYTLAHLPPAAALMGLTPVGMQALKQRERDMERIRDTEIGAHNNNALDIDERSRSPIRHEGAERTTGTHMGHHGNGNNSINGDQASTIDDSDSDNGAKDDDDSTKSDSLMGLSKKQRKARTAFTDHQLQTLEKSFERQKYLSVQDRMELANKLELSDCQVKTWYQNRRTKWKRQTAVGLELLAEAGNYAAFQRLYGGASPYLNAWPFPSHGAPSSPIDLYYRQAAAAATLQKPLSYRMYPHMQTLGPLVPSAGVSHLSGFYHPAAAMNPHGIVQSAPRPQSPVSCELLDKERATSSPITTEKYAEDNNNNTENNNLADAEVVAETEAEGEEEDAIEV